MIPMHGKNLFINENVIILRQGTQTVNFLGSEELEESTFDKSKTEDLIIFRGFSG